MVCMKNLLTNVLTLVLMGFVERKFLLKASSLDLSKILLWAIFFTTFIVGLVGHFCNNLTLAFSTGIIVFIVYAIYNEDVYLLYREWNNHNTTKGYSD